MKKLPILTCVALLALGGLRWAPGWQDQPATTPQQTNPSVEQPVAPVEDLRAVNLLRESREQLFKASSLRTRIEQKAMFGEYSFGSEGTYLAASGFRYRLEYTVKLQDMEGKFLEVCDGQVIHTRRQVGSASTTLAAQTTAPQIELFRRDLQTILRATREHQDVPDAVQAAEIGLGGLPAVLASLERNMIFDALREEELEGRPVTIIQGRWRTDRREELLGALGAMGGQLGGLMPDLVRIAFDNETRLPRQFLYLKLSSAERKTYRPVLSVDLRDLEMGIDLPAQVFNYTTPPGLQERDETDNFVKLITSAATPPEQPAPVTPR